MWDLVVPSQTSHETAVHDETTVYSICTVYTTIDNNESTYTRNSLINSQTSFQMLFSVNHGVCAFESGRVAWMGVHPRL